MDDLICCLCTEYYDGLRHSPRIWKCGHTFCFKCTVTLFNTSFYLTCPFCSRKIRSLNNNDFKNSIRFVGKTYCKLNTAISRLIGCVSTKQFLHILKFDHAEFMNTKSPILPPKYAVNKDLHNQQTKFAKHVSKTNVYAETVWLIENILSQLDKTINIHSDAISKVNLLCVNLSEKENVISDLLKVNEDNDNKGYENIICKTIHDFNNRQSKKTDHDQEYEKLALVSNQTFITEHDNDDILYTLQKTCNLSNWCNSLYYYVMTNPVDNMSWYGQVYRRDCDYRFTTLQDASKVPEDALVLQMDHFLDLLSEYQVTFYLQFEVNGDYAGLVIIRVYGNYDSFDKIAQSPLWKIINGSICFNVTDSSNGDAVLTMSSGTFAPLLVDNKIQDSNEDVYEHLPGIITLTDEQQVNICLATGESSSYCENPIGEVVEGLLCLSKVSLAILQDQEVTVVSTGLIMPRYFMDCGGIQERSYKRIKVQKEDFKDS